MYTRSWFFDTRSSIEQTRPQKTYSSLTESLYNMTQFDDEKTIVDPKDLRDYHADDIVPNIWKERQYVNVAAVLQKLFNSNLDAYRLETKFKNLYTQFIGRPDVWVWFILSSRNIFRFPANLS